MSDHAMVINYAYCTGCHTCEVACRQEKGIPVKEWGVKLAEMGPAKLAGSWEWDYVPIPSSLCDMCEERLSEGKRAACKHHCLAQCIEVVPIEEIPNALARAKGKTDLFLGN